MMKHCKAALLALVIGTHPTGVIYADVPAERTHTAIAAIEDAKSLARVGRGSLLLVGSALSTAQSPSNNVLAVLEYPIVREMRPGTILIMAKIGCDPIEACLIARRVTEIDEKGEVQTDPYTVETMLLGEVKATLLGSVSYAIDLETGTIRDMRAGHAQEPVTLSEAIEGEKAGSRNPAAARIYTGIT